MRLEILFTMTSKLMLMLLVWRLHSQHYNSRNKTSLHPLIVTVDRIQRATELREDGIHVQT